MAKLTVTEVCPTCEGVDTIDCPECQGAGRIERRMMDAEVYEALAARGLLVAPDSDQAGEYFVALIADNVQAARGARLLLAWL